MTEFMMKAFTFSSSVNAYTLYAGAKRLGIRLMTTDTRPTFPIPASDSIDPADWLFFTEEAALARALRGELLGRFLPERFPMHLLDDKWALSAWLSAMPQLTSGLRQWDMAERGDVDFPCLVKAKHSWRESVKLPRGWICRSSGDMDDCLRKIGEQGLSPDVFFFQEWLGDLDCRVISVCGFHDHRDHNRNLVAVVERIAAHTKGLSCSAAVTTIPDAWDLRGRAAAVLDALEYTGPYELEFLVTGDRVAVLELNPRFWMQHAIFLVKGNGLMKRCLGLETEADRGQRVVEDIVWIDGLHLVKAALLLQWDFVALAIGKLRDGNTDVVIWPRVPMALYVWLRLIWNKRGKIGRRVFGRPGPAKRHD